MDENTAKTSTNSSVMIRVENIHSHPDNPRKDLGDLTELVESIKKNGIMQNLTVIPISYNEEPEKQPDANNISTKSDFIVLIGHRRLAAAKQAGIDRVPCTIVSNLSKSDQVAIMLEENMQRNDLTVYEQAQGFQMMIDLGGTEDQIAEKTGFSKSTIRHRLNLAKLDQKVLESKTNEKSSAFQLSITDLYALEKIKDINTRNKVLNSATDPRDLSSRILNAVNDEKADENLKLLISELKKLGIKQAPKNAENEIYSNKWERLKDFNLYKLDSIPKFNFKDNGEQIYYLRRYSYMYIIRKAKREKKELTPQEEERKQHDRDKKHLKAIYRSAAETRRIFIEGIIHGNIEPLRDKNEEHKIEEELFEQLLSWESFVGHNKLEEFFLGCELYNAQAEAKKEAEEKCVGLSMLHKLLCLNSAILANTDLVEWNYEYRKASGEKAMKFYAVLEKYGFKFPNEEERGAMDGTSPLYVRKKSDI